MFIQIFNVLVKHLRIFFLLGNYPFHTCLNDIGKKSFTVLSYGFKSPLAAVMFIFSHLILFDPFVFLFDPYFQFYYILLTKRQLFVSLLCFLFSFSFISAFKLISFFFIFFVFYSAVFFLVSCVAHFDPEF